MKPNIKTLCGNIRLFLKFSSYIHYQFDKVCIHERPFPALLFSDDLNSPEIHLMEPPSEAGILGKGVSGF